MVVTASCLVFRGDQMNESSFLGYCKYLKLLAAAAVNHQIHCRGFSPKQERRLPKIQKALSLLECKVVRTFHKDLAGERL